MKIIFVNLTQLSRQCDSSTCFGKSSSGNCCPRSYPLESNDSLNMFPCRHGWMCTHPTIQTGRLSKTWYIGSR